MMIALASSQTCNYFSEPSYNLGAAQVIGRCIADYTNTASRLFTCSSDGESVTAQRFLDSSTCDLSSSNILSETFNSSSATAEFECDGDNSCDLCYRIYTSCDDSVISEPTNAAYEACFVNCFCSDTTGDAVRKDGQPLTERSEAISCLSNTQWTTTSYEGNSECSGSGSSDTNSIGCDTSPIDGEVYYEIIVNPCTADESVTCDELGAANSIANCLNLVFVLVALIFACH